MSRAKGMVLTERDRALLGYLGVARFATAAHVHRLIAPGHDKAIASRRLSRLCGRGPGPGDDPYLRRIEYRRTDAVERVVGERTRGADLRFGLRAFTVESAAATLAAAAAAAGPSAATPSAAPAGRVVRIDPDLARRLGDGLDLFIQAIRTLQVAGADHNNVCPNFYMPPLPADELNAFCRRLRHDVLGIPRPSGAKP